MKKILLAFTIISICLSGGACSQKAPEITKKNVEIFGTSYTIHDDWTVDQISDNTMGIFYLSERPERIDDVIMITEVPGVLQNANQYQQSKEYVEAIKKSTMASFLDKVYKEEVCDKEETAGLLCQGEKNGFENSLYYFMNNYNDAIIIQCLHHPEKGNANHEAYEKEVIDSMEFSFPGFSKASTNTSNSSSGKKADSSKNSKDDLAIRVYDWCQDRFEYYDKRDGGYTGDKHDDDVFNDAAEHFGKTVSEIKELYFAGGHY